MPNDLVTRVKETLAEVKAEMENTPAAERVPLLYILQQYETGVTNFAEYCAQPHDSAIKVNEARGKVEEMMHGLNIIASDVGYWITEIREKASKTGVLILTKLLTLISSLVRECIDELIVIVRAAGKDIAITGYSIGIGIGGYLTFGINFEAIREA